MTLDINNTVQGEVWVVLFKNDPQPRAVVAYRDIHSGRMVLKGEGYSNHIEASDHEMESAERIWPPSESETRLDPLPYVALAPYERDVPEDRIVTRGENRRDLERYDRVYFRPREQYQQIEVYYLWDQRYLELEESADA
ncbi:hypothetical protein SEA_ZOOMAN_278 [Microbacterium phage Zooman]|nr:hypothetical protein SEA_ZOOMAN_278 [Microbacterium phage Zooman]